MPDTNLPPTSQERIAKIVSIIVLTGTCVFGALGIALAIVTIARGGSIDEAKNILQILFSAILPLFGTWIGTVLAYYFSKENLLAANQTVQHLVNSITSDKKLETIKARDVMIPLDKLTYKDYISASEADGYNLKTDFLDWLTKQGISRVILLDSNKAAKYVLHRSLIEGFIAEQYFATDAAQAAGGGGPTPSVAPKALTFGDLRKKGNANVQDVLANGVKRIAEYANLSDAKVLMKNFAACNDVFITKTAAEGEPVTGWITDKTIAENSIV